MLFWITFGQLAHTKCTNAQMHKMYYPRKSRMVFTLTLP